MQKNALRKLFTSHKKDLILGAALLLAALCLFLVFRVFVGRQNGGTVTVKIDDKVIGVYSLSTDGVYPLKSLFGGENTLVIQNGQATVTNASCKDHICERMGPISKKGEMIICLPNQLFITVTDGEEGDIDAVVQ